MDLDPPHATTGREAASRWLRRLAGGGVAAAVVAIGPWSGADPASPHPAVTTCAAAPSATAPPAGDAVQTVSVEVPTIAVVDVVDGVASGAWTNAGRPPLAGDLLYVERPGGLVEAPPSIHDQVRGATWLPAGGPACDPGAWVVAEGP